MDLNKVMLIGRLTRDPEARTTPQGTAVTSFSIATSRVWKDQQGGQQEKTEYHNIVAWRRLAEIAAQYLGKGRQVYIEGYLQTQSWDDKTSGEKKYRTEIVADRTQFGPKGGSTGGTPATSSPKVPAAAEEMDSIEYPEEDINPEDIPF